MYHHAVRLYIHDVLAQVSEQAEVHVQSFFDDGVTVSGEPAEVVRPIAALQRLLP